MDATTQERIATQVRTERKRRKLSQQELAGMTGVSTNTIGNMERGTSFPQRAHLVTICGLLGINLNEGDSMDENEETERRVTEWSADVRVALNVVGLYLESFEPGPEREEHIAAIVRAIMARRL